MKMIIVNQLTGRNDVDTNEESTTPTVINAETARVFYPRKPDADGTTRAGTRITFDDGGGWAMSDSFDEVKAKFSDVGVTFLPLTMAVETQAIIDDDTGECLNANDQTTNAAMVNPNFIRCFYPRKDNKVGTRLTFGKGSGIAVIELFEDITALCIGAGLPNVARLPAHRRSRAAAAPSDQEG